jgi:phosphatidylinositol alpha-1,6-mannosyltransferase
MRAAPAVLALVTEAFGGRGGIAQYNRDFLEALAESGAVSSITVLPRHVDENANPPTGIQQVSAWPGRLGFSFLSLVTALRRHVDVVFCGHIYMVPLAALIARLKGAKLVIQVHGIEAWPRPARLQRAAVEAADLVLCVSRYTRAAVLGWATIVPERVLVVPNTVGDVFTPGENSSLRKELGLECKQVLLTVGRIDSCERYKGHDRVIAALPVLVAQGHDVAYVVVGEGDDVARLKRLAVEAGVADRVNFTGAVFSERLIEAYRMADLFVMPSTGEGFGIVFLEAMACGTPALGLAVAGAKDALADGELGAAVQEAELTDALGDLIQAPRPDPHVLSAATRTRFGKQAFADNVCEAMRRLFQTDLRLLRTASTT